MANTCLENELNKLNEQQKNDVEQLAKYKSLSASLDVTIRERAEVIRLLQSYSK